MMKQRQHNGDYLVTWRCGVITLLLLTVITCCAQQREALELFYNTCNGVNWTNNINWLVDPDTCEWFGVTCQEGSLYLELPENNVVCDSVPSALLELAVPPGTLKVLDLQGNPNVNIDFSSMEGGQRIRLEGLYVQDTALSSFENMNNVLSTQTLTSFAAGGNDILGEFPTELMNFTNLQHLDLSHNLYTGTIPEDIGLYWTDLRTWSMAHNILKGPIPSSVGTMSNLTLLFLQHNEMSGNLPVEIGNMASLATLFINDQGFNGPLLDFANNSGLVIISAKNNNLRGEVPSTFLASVPPFLSHIMMVDLRNNMLEGSLGSELARFPSWRFFATENLIEDVSGELCTDALGWYFGSVGQFGCDAILCPPGTFNSLGRQISINFPCTPCEAGTVSVFYGSTACDAPLLTIGPQGGAPPDSPQSEPERLPLTRHQDGNPDNDVASWSHISFLRGVTREKAKEEKTSTTTLALPSAEDVATAATFDLP